MRKKFKMSLVVVTFNSQNTIRACLEALISQCSAEDEIIVYDNCSTDNTPNILKSYQSRIYLKLSHRNLGFSFACNWCVQMAKDSTHIGFINPDAVVGLGLVFRAKEVLADGSVSLLGFSCKDINGADDRNFRRYPSILSNIFTIIDNIAFRFNFEFYKNFDLNIHYLDGSCMFIDRDVFLNAHQFQNFFLYGEDVILCDLLRKSGIKAIYCQDISYLHIRGSSSRSSSSERSWSMLPNIVYSELFFLRDRSSLFKFSYLSIKFLELISLVVISKLFFKKSSSKHEFFKKRLLLLAKFSWEFFYRGHGFIYPEFHVSTQNHKNIV